ncbi:hypothetical protein PIB30_036230 [Stylosanthes scabra]|uniref:Uncharacterized protein n=1 Tax=Stylosanthes scabra TaxID=79078 RepID=A0ABU6VDE0_9FABA|nr:hypothetical protein [Stylosanthes scabra]
MQNDIVGVLEELPHPPRYCYSQPGPVLSHVNNFRYDLAKCIAINWVRMRCRLRWECTMCVSPWVLL